MYSIPHFLISAIKLFDVPGFQTFFFIQKLSNLNLRIYNQRQLKKLKYAVVLFHSKVRQIQLFKVFIRSIFNALFYHMQCNALIFISWNCKSFSIHVLFIFVCQSVHRLCLFYLIESEQKILFK